MTKNHPSLANTNPALNKEFKKKKERNSPINYTTRLFIYFLVFVPNLFLQHYGSVLWLSLSV